jgi:hypothetical protein
MNRDPKTDCYMPPSRGDNCGGALTPPIAGIVGLIVNTTALVFAAQVLLLPILVAKAIAILASFTVNFSPWHFVVFRVRHTS